MNKLINIASIGGDNRQKYTVLKLCEAGYKVDEVKVLDDNMSYYDAYILPLPITVDGKHINSSNITFSEFFDNLKTNCVVFGGKADDEFLKTIRNKNIKFFDYYNRDEFSLKNAEPTAMGVLAYAINNTKCIFSKSNVLVIGYGKCGRAVGRIFNDLGAEVTAASRKYLTVAQTESDGLNGCLLKDVYDYVKKTDLIVNTVPEKILKKDFIDSIPEKAVVIDISSAPYGFDYEYAKKAGRKIILLPSIPGKYFPHTAGEIIADTIMNIIEEEDIE